MILTKEVVDAAKNGDLNAFANAVENYLKEGGDIDDCDEEKNGVLEYILLRSSENELIILEMVKYLIGKGINVNQGGTNSYQASPLYRAINVLHSIKIATVIIENNGILKKSESIARALLYMFDGLEESKIFFNLLFDKQFISIEPSLLTEWFKVMSLKDEFYNVRLKLLKYLVEDKGLDVNYRGCDLFNGTLLHVVADCARAALVSYLISKAVNALALDCWARRAIDRVLFGTLLSQGQDNDITISYRLEIVGALLRYCGKALEQLGWFDEWIKDRKKDELVKINTLRPLLAEPIEQYILTSTCNPGIEQIMEKQNRNLERIATALEQKQLQPQNQTNKQKYTPSVFGARSKL